MRDQRMQWAEASSAADKNARIQKVRPMKNRRVLTSSFPASNPQRKEEVVPSLREGIPAQLPSPGAREVGRRPAGPRPLFIPLGRSACPGYLDRESTLGGRATAGWEPRLSQLELFSMARRGGSGRKSLRRPPRLPGGRS